MNSHALEGQSLEYKRDYGTAFWNVDITNLMNDPGLKGIVCVYGPGFTEEIADLPFVEIGVLPYTVRFSMTRP